MVVDYRKLNEATITDAYPLPLISQILNDLSKARIFTKLDLVGAYQLLRIKEGYEHLTAFKTQHGLYESLVVRDGLRNAPAVFQHFLNDIFKDLLGRGVIVYIDDILIYATNVEELRRLTREVFSIIRKASLYLKASKCEFETDTIVFLGFVISSKGISTDPEKIKAVHEFPTPRNLRESRSFIGLTSYYRRFVPNFSKIAAPIVGLTKKDVPFEWGALRRRPLPNLRNVSPKHPYWCTLIRAGRRYSRRTHRTLAGASLYHRSSTTINKSIRSLLNQDDSQDPNSTTRPPRRNSSP